jgi:hypothetical protein
MLFIMIFMVTKLLLAQDHQVINANRNETDQNNMTMILL